MTIPFVTLLAVAKRILVSSTVLINAFHSFSLAERVFCFVYLSVVQLLHTSMKTRTIKRIISALAGGLLCVFTPGSIFSWDKYLQPHNHVFP